MARRPRDHRVAPGAETRPPHLPPPRAPAPRDARTRSSSRTSLGRPLPRPSALRASHPGAPLPLRRRSPSPFPSDATPTHRNLPPPLISNSQPDELRTPTRPPRSPPLPLPFAGPRLPGAPRAHRPRPEPPRPGPHNPLPPSSRLHPRPARHVRAPDTRPHARKIQPPPAPRTRCLGRSPSSGIRVRLRPESAFGVPRIPHPSDRLHAPPGHAPHPNPRDRPLPLYRPSLPTAPPTATAPVGNSAIPNINLIPFVLPPPL